MNGFCNCNLKDRQFYKKIGFCDKKCEIRKEQVALEAEKHRQEMLSEANLKRAYWS